MSREHIGRAHHEHFDPLVHKNWEHLPHPEIHKHLGALARRGENLHDIILPGDFLEEHDIPTVSTERA